MHVPVLSLCTLCFSVPCHLSRAILLAIWLGTVPSYSTFQYWYIQNIVPVNTEGTKHLFLLNLRLDLQALWVLVKIVFWCTNYIISFHQDHGARSHLTMERSSSHYSFPKVRLFCGKESRHVMFKHQTDQVYLTHWQLIFQQCCSVAKDWKR